MARPLPQEDAARQGAASATDGVSVTPRSAASERFGARVRAGGRLRLSSKELELFTQGLETQLDAGVPLIRALQTQAEQAESARVAQVCEHLLVSIRGGASITDSLEALPQVFDPVYRSMVRGGDASGNLPTILRELAGYLQWTERIRSTLRQAAVYPTLLVSVSIGVVLLVLGFVFPRFGVVLEKMVANLDAQTRFLLGAGHFVRDSWHWIVLGIVAAAGLGFAGLRTQLGRTTFFKTLAKLPLFGPVFLALDLTRLLRNVSILVGAGIPVLEAMRLALDTLANPGLRSEVRTMHEDLVAGDTLTQAFTKSPTMPRLVVSMVAVGEETGRLAEVLGRVSHHYENLSRERVAKMIAALGPLITIVMGVAIGFLVVTILKTLYSAISQVGR